MKKQKHPNSDSDAFNLNAEDKLNSQGLINGLILSEAETLKLFHELDVHKIELERQNEELRLANKKLEDYIRDNNILLLREITWEILKLRNESENLHDSIQQILDLLKSRLDVDAVAIRLKEGDDFPYYAHNGFSSEFIENENSLVEEPEENAKICWANSSNPSYSCLCGMGVSGNVRLPGSKFTKGGSWWTNNSISVQEIQNEKYPLCTPRYHCIKLEYSSIALIPIRNNDKMIGRTRKML